MKDRSFTLTDHAHGPLPARLPQKPKQTRHWLPIHLVVFSVTTLVLFPHDADPAPQPPQSTATSALFSPVSSPRIRTPRPTIALCHERAGERSGPRGSGTTPCNLAALISGIAAASAGSTLGGFQQRALHGGRIPRPDNRGRLEPRSRVAADGSFSGGAIQVSALANLTSRRPVNRAMHDATGGCMAARRKSRRGWPITNACISHHRFRGVVITRIAAQ